MASPQDPVYHFHGLDELDADELRLCLPADALMLEAPAANGAQDEHPEPFTVVAVVTLSAMALKGLTAWALKKRHKQQITIETERIDSSGARVRRKGTIVIKDSSSDREVLEQLGTLLGADGQLIADALALQAP